MTTPDLKALREALTSAALRDASPTAIGELFGSLGAMFLSLREDALRWREVAHKAWFVDAAAFAYGLERYPRLTGTGADPEDVHAAIDAALQEQQP